MKLLQTVLESNLPQEKKVLVEHEHMTNTMASRFRELDSDRTEYIAEIEYTKFNGSIFSMGISMRVKPLQLVLKRSSAPTFSIILTTASQRSDTPRSSIRSNNIFNATYSPLSPT